jgi:hypothetical protein
MVFAFGRARAKLLAFADARAPSQFISHAARVFHKVADASQFRGH